MKLQAGLDKKKPMDFSERVDVLERLKEADVQSYEDVCYQIGESFLFYYDVTAERDRYSNAAKWFRNTTDSYMIAGIYCDISDCLELINQYNGAKTSRRKRCTKSMRISGG